MPKLKTVDLKSSQFRWFFHKFLHFTFKLRVNYKDHLRCVVVTAKIEKHHNSSALFTIPQFLIIIYSKDTVCSLTLIPRYIV